MGMTDPIADMLTRIRNASSGKIKTVRMPSSGLKENIAGILKAEGYIDNFKVTKDMRQGVLEVILKYDDLRNGVIEHIERVSKPGRRVYAKGANLSRVMGGYGISILSTSKGLMVDRDARKSNIGGEVLCRVW